MPPVLVRSIFYVFASGVLLGSYITDLWIPEPEKWWQPAVVRVAWQLGCAILLGLAIARAKQSPHILPGTASLVAFTTIGVILAHDPILDLIRGPVHLRGHLSVDFHSDHRTHQRNHHHARGRQQVTAVIALRAEDGTVTTWRVSGWQAHEMEDSLFYCNGKTAELIILREVESLLSVDCQTTPDTERSYPRI